MELPDFFSFILGVTAGIALWTGVWILMSYTLARSIKRASSRIARDLQLHLNTRDQVIFSGGDPECEQVVRPPAPAPLDVDPIIKLSSIRGCPFCRSVRRAVGRLVRGGHEPRPSG